MNSNEKIILYNSDFYGYYGANTEKYKKYRNMSINEAINEANIDCNILKKDVFLTKTSIGTFFLKNPQTTKIRFCLEELNFNIKHGIKKNSMCYYFKYSNVQENNVQENNVQENNVQENNVQVICKSKRKRLPSFYK